MKQNHLIILGVGVIAYILWKKSKEAEATSEFANIGGRGRRRKFDKAQDKMLAYCRRHPESPQCGGLYNWP